MYPFLDSLLTDAPDSWALHSETEQKLVFLTHGHIGVKGGLAFRIRFD
jgi:hypothetical protein